MRKREGWTGGGGGVNWGREGEGEEWTGGGGGVDWGRGRGEGWTGGGGRGRAGGCSCMD